MGADAGHARREDARHGQRDVAGLRHRPRIRRRQDRDRGGQARRARARHRVQPGYGRARQAECGEGGRVGQSQLHEGRHLRERLLEGHRRHPVPAADAEPQAAAHASRSEAGHADRVELLHDGGLGGGRDRDAHRRTARAGARRCSGSSPRKSKARGGSGRTRSRSNRCFRRSRARSEASQSPRASCGATRSRSPSARPSTPDA